MTEVWQAAAEVVAAWLQQRRSARDLIAGDRLLHRAPPEVRAGVARLAQAVAGAWRRLEFALGGAHRLGPLAPRARAAAFVLAHQVEQGLLPPAQAEALCAAVAGCRLVFCSRPELERRLATIADENERFAVQHSMPDWLAARLRTQFGGAAPELARSLESAPPRTVRTNTLRVASRVELAAALLAIGVTTRPTSHAPLGLHVEGHADLFATPLYRRGAFEQQDEASQLAALVVAPPPGGRVLDVCAGSGGKTLALAAALRGRGEILATDVHQQRLEALRRRGRRAGADNVRTLRIGKGDFGGEVAAFAARADRLLVDAPCTGTGSWRRRPEARWSVTEPQLEALLAAQDRLLDRAADALRRGARLVYATCSLLEVENEARVAALRARRPWLETVRVAEILGGDAARPVTDATGTFLSTRPDRHGCDGFFAAVLRRPRR
ncbi:MAG TPA: RsmB/NOP family class I SAM-dependent RNA methyltransferase [Planctomycetota bacterium]|nr:RsmB/NOP family class I SAM-dependent RNA methyltransferase [Planctomycetota bacterium]